MSNYIKFNDTIAFHPGYYIKEIVDESGLTQADFAKRLDTTPKNLSLLIRGEQRLSTDIAMKLSRMLDVSVSYWLNLQSSFDSLIAEYDSKVELVQERKVFKYLDYKYFKDNFKLPNLPRKIDEQIIALRKFLKVSSLSVFTKKDMAVKFRSSSDEMEEPSIVKANVMVQLATNSVLKSLLDAEVTHFNKKKFERTIDYILTLTKDHNSFYPIIKKAFREAGVLLVILPNIPGSKINGATKKIGDNIILMVNDRRLYSDSFWFTLLHEVGHIMYDDYGVSFEKETGTNERQADKYAEDHLIPPNKYKEFISNNRFDLFSIKEFANQINRDPGIILGRLQNDGFVEYNDWRMKSLKHKYKVEIEQSIHFL